MKGDMKFEVVVIPVSDVERAKRFYAGLGWRLDIDIAPSEDYRIIQFTPPGSACSIIFGTGFIPSAPGSVQGLHLVISDIEAARADLIERGVKVSELFHDGPQPQRKSYGTYLSFRDPDGNGWFLQEVTSRLPGHELSFDIGFTSSIELARAMKRAAAAHEAHERRIGKQDANWADWYASYISAEQAGTAPPS